MIAPLRIRPGDAWAASIAPLLDFAREVLAHTRGPVLRETRIDTALLPTTIDVPMRPASVALWRAVTPGASHVLSGGSIEWEMVSPGRMRLHALSALASTTVYDVTLALTEAP